jgi:peptidoglycan/LPS O-acetylase OafA/YrhL
MTEVQKTGNGGTTAMRWVARILALIAVGLFVFFAVELGSKVFPALSWGPQGIPLLVAVAVAMAGVLVAWRWELVGGVMTVAGVAAIMALVCLGSGTDMFFCAFLFTLPLLLAGGLFLACCWRTRQPRVA